VCPASALPAARAAPRLARCRRGGASERPRAHPRYWPLPPSQDVQAAAPSAVAEAAAPSAVAELAEAAPSPRLSSVTRPAASVCGVGRPQPLLGVIARWRNTRLPSRVMFSPLNSLLKLLPRRPCHPLLPLSPCLPSTGGNQGAARAPTLADAARRPRLRAAPPLVRADDVITQWQQNRELPPAPPWIATSRHPSGPRLWRPQLAAHARREIYGARMPDTCWSGACWRGRGPTRA